MQNLTNEFIHIPAWGTEGLVIDQESPMYGPDGTIRVFVMEHPEDDRSKWYNLKPGEYEVMS